MSPIHTRALAGLATALTVLFAAAAASADGPYAPIDRPGPPLTVSRAQLAASLKCDTNLSTTTAEPALLVPATTVNSRQNFSWSYELVLKAHGIPYCTSDLPGSDQYNMDDIQNRADYLVYAIRTMYHQAGRPIAMIGASQGGEAERWPLRFWPDTRSMIADVIALDSPNHGSTTVDLLCTITCAPSLWQQGYNSHYMQALNSDQETFAGISYTDIATTTDDFVEPNSPTHSTVFLDGPGQITNVDIQQICRGTIADHLLVASSNPIAAALALNAITHPGPADPARINRSVCTAGPFAQGVPLSTSITGFAGAAAEVADQLATARHVPSEPPLRCYVYASCHASANSARTATAAHGAPATRT